MDPDGPATWLVTLELNLAAISLCAIAVGPNSAMRHHYLAGGPPAPVRDISTVGYPAFLTGPIGIGGRAAVKRPVKCPVKLKNMEVISLFYKNTDQKWTVFSPKIILDKYKFIYQ